MESVSFCTFLDIFVAVAGITLINSEKCIRFKNRKTQHPKGIDTLQNDLQI